MATRRSSTRKAGSSSRRASTRRRSTAKAAAEAAMAAPRLTAAERRRMAQEEARWRAESDLRTLRQAEEIRRDAARLQRASTVAAEEMRALQAVRAIRRAR